MSDVETHFWLEKVKELEGKHITVTLKAYTEWLCETGNWIHLPRLKEVTRLYHQVDPDEATKGITTTKNLFSGQ